MARQRAERVFSERLVRLLKAHLSHNTDEIRRRLDSDEALGKILHSKDVEELITGYAPRAPEISGLIELGWSLFI